MASELNHRVELRQLDLIILRPFGPAARLRSGGTPRAGGRIVNAPEARQAVSGARPVGAEGMDQTDVAADPEQL
jgi:hypothetical protein